jgi:Tol biopolymer transport system component
VKRAYIIAAAFLVVGLSIGIAELVTNQVLIPDVPTGSLHLHGRLLLAQQQGVFVYDLSSGSAETLFTPDQGGLVAAAALSPDGSTLLLAYAPPAGFIQFGFTNLYGMPAGGSEPPHLLVDGQQQDVIYGPLWSGDGASVTYVRSHASSGGLASQLSIERIGYPGGTARTLVANGFAPDLSADGQRMAYVAVGQGTLFDSLYVADPEGRQAVALAGGERFQVIDRPSFSPDGLTLLFSGDEKPFAAGAHPVQPRMIDWADFLPGQRIASAHNITVSDIWTISAAGGKPRRLLKILAEGIALDYAPDGQHIAFVTTHGLYIMNADGSQPARISARNQLQSVQWLPDQ